MDKRYDHKKYEENIYSLWEKSGSFTPKRDPKKKPYTIVIPPPNASGKMHTGNVLMIAIEDLLIRWKRMQGYSALWLPGTDHAGFETQTTFERKLTKEGKTRFEFDRNALYKQIHEFVMDNKHKIENQLRQMGASVDWSRYSFTLDPHALKIVANTFEKLEKEGMVYRDSYLVNYSFKWGTTFSDAEVVYKKAKTKLCHVRFPFKTESKFKGKDYVVAATVRPETIFVDTHLAVNPKDKSKKELIGKNVLNPLTGKVMDIISDEFVDPKFGTGIVKITPAHDKNDFTVGKKHNLPIKSVITFEGRMNANANELEGESILSARKKTIEILQNKDLVEEIIEDYEHLVPVDYRSGDYIENLIMPNWFLKVDKLKKPAYDVVKNGKVKIYPKWREKTYLRWMESMHDWAISRQIVWGIRIPAWYDTVKNPDLLVSFIGNDKRSHKGKVGVLRKRHSLSEIEKGLQALLAPKGSVYKISDKKPGKNYIQETDTFDTWFSSGQWPLITLRYPESLDFKYFYPTDVLETGWEIVTRWVSRMIMFGIYLTGKAPFKNIYLHGHIRALDGRKMSKSLGNVVNPDDYVNEYGVDALRMGLISGTANGKDFNFPKDKIISYRNFANKIWNMARFMLYMFDQNNINRYSDLIEFSKLNKKELTQNDKQIIKGFKNLKVSVDKKLNKFRFADAADSIYHFMWEDLASNYLESIKNRKDVLTALSVYRYIYLNSLKLSHPFMPFITEAIWGELKKYRKYPKQLLISSSWPQVKE
jgi:valyl-tRNA synthetase